MVCQYPVQLNQGLLIPTCAGTASPAGCLVLCLCDQIEDLKKGGFPEKNECKHLGLPKIHSVSSSAQMLLLRLGFSNDDARSGPALGEKQREHISQSKERVTSSFLFHRQFAVFLVFPYSSFPLSPLSLFVLFFLMPLPFLHRYTLKTVLQCSLVQDYSVLYEV